MLSKDSRIERIRALLEERKLSALVATRHESVAYISGVYQRWGTVVIIPVKGYPKLISCEIERVKDETWITRGFDFEGIGFYEPIPTSIKKALVDLGLENGKIGVEQRSMTVVEMKSLKNVMPRTRFVDASEVLPSMMLVKENWEIGYMKRACQIADAGIKAAIEHSEVGRKELEVAGEMDCVMKCLGSGHQWFPTHVASGTRSDLAMAYATEKIIQEGDKIALDVGPTYNLYCAELTTPIIIGSPGRDLKRLAESTGNVHETLFDSIRPGITAEEVGKIGANIAQKTRHKRCAAGGRGIGIISNEELLMLNDGCKTEIKKNMVIATNTFIWNSKGQKIGTERTILIGERKNEWLTKHPLSLVEI